MQANGSIGYVQPIGSAAVPGQIITATNTANFGVGAFLLAASELTRLPELATDLKSTTSTQKHASIFPNPAGSSFNLSTDATQPAKVSIYSISGIELMSVINRGTPIIISGLANGTYLVKADNVILKLIKR